MMRYQPQLATLVKKPPLGDTWLHEVKYDGYRIGALVQRGRARLLSRNAIDWTDRFPSIATAVERLPARNAVLDGEVAVVAAGRTSFQALQNSLGARAADLHYFVFDLLHLDGRDVAALPLEERKRALADLLAAAGDGPLHYADHVVGGGPRFFAAARAHGFEGMISKQRREPHRAGRTAGWLKTKCVTRQELVIGGFTDPEGSRTGLGALLVGTYDDTGERLSFAGKVGTGFTQKIARELRRTLDAIETRTCPFAERPSGWLGTNAHWVRPTLVAEVEFTEWTADGKVRHPSFQGLRQDKPAREVRRERAAPARARTRATTDAPEVAGVRISSATRLMWPDASITKLDLARYLDEVAPWMLPHVEGRPLTLVRCPKGFTGEDSCHFMRHTRSWGPAPLRRVSIREKTKVGEYLVADDTAALVALAQMDVIEIHTWNTRDAAIERPDRVVFDLDPGPGVAWKTVVAAARTVKRTLEALDLECWVKTTGGAGLHLVAPIRPERDWSDCLAFSRDLAASLARQMPELFTVTVARAGRDRLVYIDYLRNNRTNTSVAAYSPRARPRAPVSTPLAWREVTARLRPERFTIDTVRRRLTASSTDAWSGYTQCRQRLTAAHVQAVAATARKSPESAVKREQNRRR